MAKHVLVIGATLLDTKGKPLAGLARRVRRTRAKFGRCEGARRAMWPRIWRGWGPTSCWSPPSAMTRTGRQLLIQTAEAGVNLDYVEMLPGRATGSYLALLEPDGLLSVALDDVRVMEAITADYLNRNRALFSAMRR